MYPNFNKIFLIHYIHVSGSWVHFSSIVKFNHRTLRQTEFNSRDVRGKAYKKTRFRIVATDVT